MAGAPGAGSGPWSHGVVLPFCEAVSDLAEAGGAQEIHEIHEVMGQNPGTRMVPGWYPDGHRLV